MFCGPPDQLPASMLDLNWDQRTGPSGHFESSLGSIVPPSPSSSSPVSAESVAFRKFMGGSQTTIGNSGGMPPQFGQIGVRLNSSPKLDLSVTDHLHQAHQLRGLPMPGGDPIPRTHFDFSVAPGFAEASARFSMFDGHGHLAAQLGVLGTRNGESPKTNGVQNEFPEGRLQIPELGGLKLEINNDNLVNSREESSVSDSAKEEASNAKKRKAPPRGKGKSTGPDTSATDHSKDAKRCCSVEENGAENDEDKSNVEKNDGSSSNNGYGGHKQGKKSTTTKPTEPPKDYIHVRARRGQATDSHSLAERVRREKISQRMKLLQDLVPGCNKITGKAVMLDEIINYVQSLQRQVEFLSMKLATVNPHLDFSNLGNLLPKMHQTCGTKPKLVYSLEASGVTPPYADQSQERTSLHCLLPNGMETQGSRNQLPDSGFHRSLNTHQPLLAGFEGASTQIGNLWGDDFQNVHMDIGQN